MHRYLFFFSTLIFLFNNENGYIAYFGFIRKYRKFLLLLTVINPQFKTLIYLHTHICTHTCIYRHTLAYALCWVYLFSEKNHLISIVLSSPSPTRRSIFKYNWFELKFTFSWTGCLPQVKYTRLPYYLPRVKGRNIRFMPFPRTRARSEKQTAQSRIWNQIVDSISYVDNQRASSLIDWQE